MTTNSARKDFKDMNFFEKFRATGPAWMSAGLNIGGATVTNSVIMAAATGLAYGWGFAFAVLASFFSIYAAVRLTAITGKNPIRLIKEEIGTGIAWAVAIAVLVSNMIFYTIQVSLIGDSFQTIFPGMSYKIGMLIGIGIAAALILIPGESAQNVIQKGIQVMIYGLTLSYVISLFIIDINWGEVVKALFSFTLPKTNRDVLLFTAVLGSAMPINAPFLQAYASKSSNYAPEDLPLLRFETAITNLFLLFVQLSVLIVVASTLYVRGITPSTGLEAAEALRPIAGNASSVLFALGMFGAALSTLTANTSIAAYIITDLMDWKTEPGTKKFKGVQGAMLLIALSIPIFGWNAYSVTSWGGAFNSLFMPVGLVAWLYLNNKKELMGEHKFKTAGNIGTVIALLISSMTAIRFIFENFL